MQINFKERYKLLRQRISELADAFPRDQNIQTLLNFVGLLDSDVFSFDSKGCLIIGDGTPPCDEEA